MFGGSSQSLKMLSWTLYAIASSGLHLRMRPCPCSSFPSTLARHLVWASDRRPCPPQYRIIRSSGARIIMLIRFLESIYSSALRGVYRLGRPQTLALWFTDEQKADILGSTDKCSFVGPLCFVFQRCGFFDSSGLSDSIVWQTVSARKNAMWDACSDEQSVMSSVAWARRRWACQPPYTSS